MNRTICLLVILMIWLQQMGCSSYGGAYVDSREVPDIVVPDDLDAPAVENALLIPGLSAPELAGLRDEARPPQVLTSEEAAASTSSIAFGNGALYLLIEDEATSVYRRLGFTLARGQMELLERKDAERKLVFRYQQVPAKVEKGFFGAMAFWKDSYGPNYSGDYQVRLEPDDDNRNHTRIYLYTMDGRAAAPQPVEHIFGQIQERLG